MGDDAVRCKNIELETVYDELQDISYLKWYNHPKISRKYYNYI